MECPSCRGSSRGCKHCSRGRIELRGCPKRHVNDDALLVLQVLDSGVLPVAGGYLDQTQWFADVKSFISAEEHHWTKVDANGRKTT